MKSFFHTGLLDVVITTCFGSISWQLIASIFPHCFFIQSLCERASPRLSVPQVDWCLRGGVSHFAFFMRRIMSYHRDEEYVGTAEECAAWAKAD